jgi:hypothetical protein
MGSPIASSVRHQVAAIYRREAARSERRERGQQLNYTEEGDTHVRTALRLLQTLQ